MPIPRRSRAWLRCHPEGTIRQVMELAGCQEHGRHRQCMLGKAAQEASAQCCEAHGFAKGGAMAWDLAGWDVFKPLMRRWRLLQHMVFLSALSKLGAREVLELVSDTLKAVRQHLLCSLLMHEALGATAAQCCLAGWVDGLASSLYILGLPLLAIFILRQQCASSAVLLACSLPGNLSFGPAGGRCVATVRSPCRSAGPVHFAAP